MPGPHTEGEALAIRDAMDADRYIESYHFGAERSRERRIDLVDVRAAIAGATKIEPYAGAARNGGTAGAFMARTVTAHAASPSASRRSSTTSAGASSS